MTESLKIAGYCRISVDEELDRDNTSIENQKSIIDDFARRKFPDATLDFYSDRDRSGYTFEQREGYQTLRPQLMNLTYDILIVKDFSRFSRRNSKGLVELEDLRDAGLRIISIGDSIDYPTYDDWTAIQFRFLINEMPVTDASKKVKSVISNRQSEGKWICAVPYGYVMTNSKTMAFEVDEAAADVVRKIYALYNDGWGYKKIANYLTDEHIPTPRAAEKQRKDARGEDNKIVAKTTWSIITVSEILSNDFYIGTLRQHKYKRRKINGSDVKLDDMEHIVFENNHEPIIDYRTFAVTREQLKKRSVTNYRGVKKYDNVYSGFMRCGDCGSPMFSMSRRDLRPAYTCGEYHKRGLQGCTSHHTRVDVLDTLLKSYVKKVRDNSADMLDKLNESLKSEREVVRESTSTVELLQRQIDDARSEMKILARQQAKELLRNPDRETAIDELYREMLDELSDRIDGLTHQLQLTSDRRNTIIRVNRIAKTALDIFDDVLRKEKLDKTDLELIIDQIVVFEDHIEIKLKADIDALLKSGELSEEAANFKPDTEDNENRIVQASEHRRDKVFRVNVISNGDPLEIYTEKDGEVIFKKYSPMGEWSESAKQLCETMHKTAECFAAVADRDTYIAVCGVPKRELNDEHISNELEQLMEARRLYQRREGERGVPMTENGKYIVEIAAPILSEGDVLGCVVFFSEGNKTVGEVENKLAQTVAAFLGKQMEP
ncbi:MAG: recombinase family protein [Oscillospiraceae bacterium]|jgi:stage V sporulation protein T|nr:recombinase family protein [Oscillospiraceae bacterium]